MSLVERDEADWFATLRTNAESKSGVYKEIIRDYIIYNYLLKRSPKSRFVSYLGLKNLGLNICVLGDNVRTRT